MKYCTCILAHPTWSLLLACQVFGPESSGKTTLAMHAIAEVQRQGGTAALIDAEHAFDPVYSKVSCTLKPPFALLSTDKQGPGLPCLPLDRIIHEHCAKVSDHTACSWSGRRDCNAEWTGS